MLKTPEISGISGYVSVYGLSSKSRQVERMVVAVLSTTRPFSLKREAWTGIDSPRFVKRGSGVGSTSSCHGRSLEVVYVAVGASKIEMRPFRCGSSPPLHPFARSYMAIVSNAFSVSMTVHLGEIHIWDTIFDKYPACEQAVCSRTQPSLNMNRSSVSQA